MLRAVSRHSSGTGTGTAAPTEGVSTISRAMLLFSELLLVLSMIDRIRVLCRQLERVEVSSVSANILSYVLA